MSRSIIRQNWKTHNGGDMNKEDPQHESTQGQLPTKSHVGEAFTY